MAGLTCTICGHGIKSLLEHEDSSRDKENGGHDPMMPHDGNTYRDDRLLRHGNEPAWRKPRDYPKKSV